MNRSFDWVIGNWLPFQIILLIFLYSNNIAHSEDFLIKSVIPKKLLNWQRNWQLDKLNNIAYYEDYK
jgi:hypothetical protein